MGVSCEAIADRDRFEQASVENSCSARHRAIAAIAAEIRFPHPTRRTILMLGNAAKWNQRVRVGQDPAPTIEADHALKLGNCFAVDRLAVEARLAEALESLSAARPVALVRHSSGIRRLARRSQVVGIARLASEHSNGWTVHETYRMLGREHEADLEREAARRALGALLPARARLTKQVADSVRRILLRLHVRMPRPRGPANAGALACSALDSTTEKTPHA
jgi:hypothetical protein